MSTLFFSPAGSIELVDLGAGELEPRSADKAVELLDARRARDRRGHAFARDQPGQGHLRGRRAVRCRDRIERFKDAKAALVEILAGAFAAHALTEVFLRAIFAGQESRRQAVVSDDAD